MNFLKLFSESFQDNWESPALTDLKTSATLTYGTLAAQMERLHLYLEGVGVKHGSRVAVVGRNSIDWITVYMSCITYGCSMISFPAMYDINTMIDMLLPVNIEYLFIDDDMLPEDCGILSRLTTLKLVVNMAGSRVLAERPGMNLEADDKLDKLDMKFLSVYPYGFTPNFAIAPVIPPEAVTAIFYTAGTIAKPRPVMLMADNLEGNIIYGLRNYLSNQHSNVVITTMLGSVWGTIFNLMLPLAAGAHITVMDDVRNPQALINAFKLVKPRRIMLSAFTVNDLYKALLQQYGSKLFVRIFSRGLGLKYLSDRLLGSAFKRMLGGACRELMIGSVGINPELSFKLRKAGIPYTAVYGLTECGGLVGYSNVNDYVSGTVGRPCKNLVRCRVRPYTFKGLPDNAGILEIHGMTVMKGYAVDYGCPAEYSLDGWFSTGDIVTMDKEGNITIYGRKDTLIHLSRGVVAPERVQRALLDCPEIANALVIERDDKILAVVHPNYKYLETLQHGHKSDINEVISNTVTSLNRTLSLIEHIDKVEISKEPLHITWKGTVARYKYEKVLNIKP